MDLRLACADGNRRVHRFSSKGMQNTLHLYECTSQSTRRCGHCAMAGEGVRLSSCWEKMTCARLPSKLQRAAAKDGSGVVLLQQGLCRCFRQSSCAVHARRSPCTPSANTRSLPIPQLIGQVISSEKRVAASKPGRPKGSRAQKRTAEDLERPVNLVRVLESVRQKLRATKCAHWFCNVLREVPLTSTSRDLQTEHWPLCLRHSACLYPSESRCPLCDMRALVRASKRARACLCVFVSVCAYMSVFASDSVATTASVSVCKPAPVLVSLAR